MSNESTPRAHLSRSLRRGAGIACLVAAALVLPGPASRLAAQETNLKIAIVDLDRIVANSNSGKKLQADLEQFQKDAQAQADELTKEATDLRRRISEGSQSLSEDKLSELQKEFEDKTIEIRRFRDDKQREGQKIQDEGLRKIEEQLRPIFQKIRDEGGYDLILNNVPGVVVSASAKIDITDQVVQQLNQSQGQSQGQGSPSQ